MSPLLTACKRRNHNARTMLLILSAVCLTTAGALWARDPVVRLSIEHRVICAMPQAPEYAVLTWLLNHSGDQPWDAPAWDRLARKARRQHAHPLELLNSARADGRQMIMVCYQQDSIVVTVTPEPPEDIQP